MDDERRLRRFELASPREVQGIDRPYNGRFRLSQIYLSLLDKPVRLRDQRRGDETVIMDRFHALRGRDARRGGDVPAQVALKLAAGRQLCLRLPVTLRGQSGIQIRKKAFCRSAPDFVAYSIA